MAAPDREHAGAIQYCRRDRFSGVYRVRFVTPAIALARFRPARSTSVACRLAPGAYWLTGTPTAA